MRKVDGLLALSLCLAWAAYHDPAAMAVVAGAGFIPVPSARLASKPHGRAPMTHPAAQPWLEALLGAVSILIGADLLDLHLGATLAVLALYAFAVAVSPCLRRMEAPRLALRHPARASAQQQHQPGG